MTLADLKEILQKDCNKLSDKDIMNSLLILQQHNLLITPKNSFHDLNSTQSKIEPFYLDKTRLEIQLRASKYIQLITDLFDNDHALLFKHVTCLYTKTNKS